MGLKYRYDIDGLRAIAVISVILFHLGFLPNGYLGVDVFFVISGYLITGIVYNEVLENKFSIIKFYERRIRRIVPLVLVTTLVAFIFGLFFMLPDDLENLCQSVFASNFSSNNILMLITSSDYWAVKNDYKPLMHTWSLGIEEQFYLFFPVIFYFFKDNKKKYILSILIVLTLISFVCFLNSTNESSKFYLLPYRFFELSLGGIFAIVFKKDDSNPKYTIISKYALYLLLLLLVFMLFYNIKLSHDLKLILTTIFTVGVLVIGADYYKKDFIYKSLLTNKIITGIGRISFSLYMWHQIVFAFARYFLFEEMSNKNALLLSFFVLLLSIITYFFIENPLRKKEFIKTKPLMLIISVFFILITSASFYIYAIGGIIKDIPELGIKKSESSHNINFFDKHNNINIQYNENIKEFDKNFSSNKKLKILIIGDSFARDFSNILLESVFKKDIELSYCDYESENSKKTLFDRANKANLIFFSTNTDFSKEKLNYFKKLYSIDINKVWIVGIKDFGNSNGFFYNKKKINQNYTETTFMKKGILELNNKLQLEWGNKYINLIDLVIDSKKKVLVFTPDNKFISQDTLHLTKFGSVFFSNLLIPQLNIILGIENKIN